MDYSNIIPPPPLLFLWLSAVRVRTHPWAKESKIDHTSNRSRCTGAGSGSGADLSHAGKIMHPELTAQHTRLPGTSFGKRSRNFAKDPKPGEGNHPPPPDCPVKDSRTYVTAAAREWRPHIWDPARVSAPIDGGSLIVSGGLLAMAQPLRREGKTTRSLPITVSQRAEPDPVRPPQCQRSVAQHRRHTLPIPLCLLPTSISPDGSVMRRSSCASAP